MSTIHVHEEGLARTVCCMCGGTLAASMLRKSGYRTECSGVFSGRQPVSAELGPQCATHGKHRKGLVNSIHHLKFRKSLLRLTIQCSA